METAYKLVHLTDYVNRFLYGHARSAALQCNQKEDDKLIIPALADNLTPFLNPWTTYKRLLYGSLNIFVFLIILWQLCHYSTLLCNYLEICIFLSPKSFFWFSSVLLLNCRPRDSPFSLTKLPHVFFFYEVYKHWYTGETWLRRRKELKRDTRPNLVFGSRRYMLYENSTSHMRPIKSTPSNPLAVLSVLTRILGKKWRGLSEELATVQQTLTSSTSLEAVHRLKIVSFILIQMNKVNPVPEK